MATRFDIVSDIKRVCLHVHYESTKKMKGKNKSLPCVEKETRFSHCTKAQYARISHNMNRSQKMKTHRLKRGFPLLILSTARTRVDCQRNHKCTCAVVVNSWEDRMCLCSESKKRQEMGCWRRDESSCTHNPTVGHRLNWAWSRERLLNCPLGLNDLPSSASC